MAIELQVVVHSSEKPRPCPHGKVWLTGEQTCLCNGDVLEDGCLFLGALGSVEDEWKMLTECNERYERALQTIAKADKLSARGLLQEIAQEALTPGSD